MIQRHIFSNFCVCNLTCFAIYITESGRVSLTSTTKESHLSLSVSESETQMAVDSEKKPLEPIPEGDVKDGGEATSLPSASGGKGAETGDVICNPDTVNRDVDKSGDDEHEKQEVTKL